ncbi:MAG: hypothetical protein ACLPY1_01140 [Terracidiphilus sp.]
MSGITPKSAHQQVLDKLDWAEQHLNKLNSALRVFHDTHPVSTLTKIDPETGELTYYVREVPPIPSHIPLIAGDVLYSLRGALDYLACGIVPVVSKDTKFPIAHSAEAYESSLGKVVDGIQQEALESLSKIKPYQGGNQALWTLHKLNNIDKHRLLLAVSTINPMHDLTPEEMAIQEPLGPKDFAVTFPTGARGIVRFAKKGLPVPLYAGQKLLAVPDTEANQDVRFYFTVGINEPGIAEGMPLNMLIYFLSCEVKRCIKLLARFIVR